MVKKREVETHEETLQKRRENFRHGNLELDHGQATQSAEAYLKECLRIEPLTLNEEFIRTPSDMAYWSEQYAIAYKAQLEAKLRKDEVYAYQTKYFRDILAEKNGKVTVGEVDAAVILCDEYKEVSAALVNAEAERVRLTGVLEALRAKKDMLISLGAHMRAEMDMDISINDKEGR